MNEFNQLPTPDFSDGAEFLSGVRARIERIDTRRRRVTGALAAPLTIALFLLSFYSLEQSQSDALWQEYVSTQDEYLEVEYYQESMADLEWELYVSSLLAEDDLDMLIEEILEFENAETLLAFNREG